MLPRGLTMFSNCFPSPGKSDANPLSLSLSQLFSPGQACELPPCNPIIMQSMRPCLSSPSSHRFLSCSPSPFSTLSSLRPCRSHALRPLSSLRETKKATLRKASNVPPNLKFDNRKGRDDGSVSEDWEGELGGETTVKGTVLAGLLLVGVIGGFGTVGYVYKDHINAFLTQFSAFIEGYGPAGYALFVLVYAGLEVIITGGELLLSKICCLKYHSFRLTVKR
ncbi:hypothetical protein COCNU_contig69486756G000010 [Cocos nucifera]|nr:hypothetical protein [Cocos nucifera]